MRAGSLSGEFLGVDGRRIFVLSHSPARKGARSVLIVPPFAEEMNKSRRMMSLVAQALVERGVAVVIPDLYGTGDSEGDFEQADWDEWVTNICEVRRWSDGAGFPTEGIVGIRLGCALGIDALKRDGSSVKAAVLWQPIVDGARALDQFLRLRVAATAMNGNARESVTMLRDRLQGGEAIEVAGYRLSPRLAEQLSKVRLDESGLIGVRSHWMEVVSNMDAATPAATARAIESLRARGCEVEYRRTVGEPFWVTTEIATVPPLIDCAVDALCRSS